MRSVWDRVADSRIRPCAIIEAGALRSPLGSWAATERFYATDSPTEKWCRNKGLNTGEHKFRPQSADRGAAERQAAAIERGQIHHDRQPQPRSRLGFVEPLAAARDLRPLGLGQATAVIIDDDP